MSDLKRSIQKGKDFLAQESPANPSPDEASSQPHSSLNSGDLQSKHQFVLDALDLLKEIHYDALAEEESTPAAVANVVEDSQNKAVIFSLCEVVAVLGIEPYLSKGNLVPYRLRSKLLVTQTDPNQQHSDEPYVPRIKSLAPTIAGLCEIFRSSGQGISRIVRDRVLLDTFSGAAEIACHPIDHVSAVHTGLKSTRAEFHARLRELANNTPMQWLLPNMTALLKASPNAWFKSAIAELIAVVPLRPNGARNVIDFIATVHGGPPVMADDGTPATSQRAPQITPEVVSKLGTTFSSVPMTTTPDIWFPKILTQLFELVDQPHSSGLPVVAAKIMSNGILSKRSTGAPDTPAWKFFSQCILEKISPIETNLTSKPSIGFETIVSQGELETAIRRFLTIIEETNSPGVVHRFTEAIFVQVWGLYHFAKQRNPKSELTSNCWKILATYTTRCRPSKALKVLSEKLLWSHPFQWEFAPGNGGGVEIRRSKTQQPDPLGMLELMNELEDRVQDFIKLLELLKPPDDDCINDIFVGAMKKCLTPEDQSDSGSNILGESNGPDPMQALTNVTITRALLEKLPQRLGKGQMQMYTIISQILDNYVDILTTERERRRQLEQPKFQDLKHIIGKHNVAGNVESQNDQEETASMALSLLHTMVTSAEEFQAKDTQVSLEALLPKLSRLEEADLGTPSSIADAVRNIKTLLNAIVPQPNTASKDTENPSHDDVAQDREIYRLAIADFTAKHAAVRAEAITLLSKLIEQGSPVIDPTTIAYILLGAPLKDEDEFVHLAAIKTIDILAQRFPLATVKILLDAYADKNETRALDERLRMGEAISRILESAAQAQESEKPKSFGSNEATMILEALVGVAGRRGTRLKEARQRELQNVRRDAESRRAWGGEVPEMPSLGQKPLDKASAAEAETLQRILQTWEGTGAEEDVRIRTSALSLLGRLLESQFNLPSPASILATLDLVSDTLTFEKEGVEKAIVRRSAILVILSALHGLQSVLNGRTWLASSDEKVRLAVQLDAVAQMLHAVRATDVDELARQHAADLLESLENFKLHAAVTTEQDEVSRMPIVGGRLAGLDVSLPGPGENDGSRTQGRIVELMDQD